ncbi:hypothetical protein AK830_g8214 [Neonectria ditissima]|uniref:SigF-like NTF2-like domain-containing protein n=1 Tax=Neonectria ditissima TaxID=78410 RepID=A0A0P7AUX4_9HYPO|nr:hypothetical protein AK830_g8214 [Neonectria ditissima]
METPAKEITGVIKLLTQGSPREQEATVSRYFLENASFSHPYCRVPSFSKGSIPFARHLSSRWAVLAIYQWYRTLSPHIDITIDSVTFNQDENILYVSIRQTFAVWFIPFYKAPVQLLSVLRLAKKDILLSDNESENAKGLSKESEEPLYYIASQQDLYALTDCIQFLLPRLGPLLWSVWQLFSTFLCVLGKIVFSPVYSLLNKD